MDTLIIADDADLAALLRLWAEDRGLPTAVINAEEFLAGASTPAELVLVQPGTVVASQVPAHIKAHGPDGAVIMLAENPLIRRTVRGVLVAADAYCRPPFDLDELESAVVGARRDLELRRRQGVRLHFVMGISSDMKNMDPARRFFAAAFKRIGLEQGKNWELQMIIEELIANSMEHGNSYDPRRLVALQLTIRGSTVEFTVEDQGPGFDYETKLDAARNEPDQNRARGRGLFMALHVAKSVEYANNGRMAHVVFNADGAENHSP